MNLCARDHHAHPCSVASAALEAEVQPRTDGNAIGSFLDRLARLVADRANGLWPAPIAIGIVDR
jgi:hypothetical protein